MHETCALAQCVAQTQFTDVLASLVDDCKIMVLDTWGPVSWVPCSPGRSGPLIWCEPWVVHQRRR
jgi:hypothetical protein